MTESCFYTILNIVLQ